MATTYRKSLTCTCCGSDAGRWLQHWNQDTGYGLCTKCRDWIWGRDRFGTPEEFHRTYGIPGQNFEAWPVGHPAATFNKTAAAQAAESQS